MTVCGSLKLCSTLTVPLDVMLTTVSSDDGEDAMVSSSSPSSGVRGIMSLPPNGDLPSLLISKSGLGGVVFRAVSLSSRWSKVYPLPDGDGWNKPPLLVEVWIWPIALILLLGDTNS